MSSAECPVPSLKTRLVRVYTLYTGAVSLLSVSFFLAFLFMHHHDLAEHRTDEIVILAFFLALLVLFGVVVVCGGLHIVSESSETVSKEVKAMEVTLTAERTNGTPSPSA